MDGIEALNTLSTAFISGAALLVSGGGVLAAACRLRGGETGTWCRLTAS